MDYLEWELERQRAALAALLGGGTEDGETVLREKKRRSPAEPDAARERAAGSAGRYAEGPGGVREPEDKHPERREEARKAEGTGTAGTPVSAWEEPLRVGGGSPEERDGMGAPAFAGERGRVRPDGGTGVRPDLAEDSKAYRARRGAGAEAPAGDDREERSAAGGVRRTASLRGGGGGAAGALDRDGLPLFRGAEETGGTGPWGGGRGTAAHQAEDSARALSRAIQRDARRYDGGFYIY